ncbi:MAG: hypothetical protein IJ315_04775 [Firmicutes bacterium]|nr:hypothetical protein [Bacillota bacterium]
MRTLQQIIHELSQIPAGSLVVRNDRNETRYLYSYSQHGLRHFPTVPSELLSEALHLNDLRFLLEEELKFYFQQLLSSEVKKIKKTIKTNRQRCLARIIANHRPYPETHTIYTPHGDFVASKTEALISMQLIQMKVKFYYEKRLQITKDYAIFPDFTLIINGQEYYYEHLGKMHEASYRANWQKRLKDYHSVGIYEGDRLFTTTEYNNCVDMVKIQEELEAFIQSKM